MRSVTFVVVGLFLIYSIHPPQARAGEGAPKTVAEATEQLFAMTQDAGIRILDEDQKEISLETLNRKPPKHFTVLAEEEGHALKYEVSIGDLKSKLSYSVVASDVDTQKTIGRRTFLIDPKADVKEAKLALKQTSLSLERQIAKHLGTKQAEHRTINKLKLAFIGLFGIPTAHASPQAEKMWGLGIISIVVCGFALIAITLMIEASTKASDLALKSGYQQGAIILGVTVGAGIVTALILTLCSDELVAIIRAMK